MRPTLKLKRDALTDLAPAQLVAVAGGLSSSCPLAACIDQVTTDINELREDVKDALNYTREGCTPAYGMGR